MLNKPAVAAVPRVSVAPYPCAIVKSLLTLLAMLFMALSPLALAQGPARTLSEGAAAAAAACDEPPAAVLVPSGKKW